MRRVIFLALYLCLCAPLSYAQAPAKQQGRIPTKQPQAKRPRPKRHSNRKKEHQPDAYNIDGLVEPLDPPPEWEFLTASAQHFLFINRRTLAVQPDHTIKVWMKTRPRPSQLTTIRKQLRTALVDFDADRYWEDIGLFQVDCRGRKSRMLSYTDYDISGTALHSDQVNEDWHDVIPGTVNENILDFVCRQH